MNASVLLVERVAEPLVAHVETVHRLVGALALLTFALGTEN
jgi:hypothetical protein